jgi:hypothetical protein
MVELEGSMNLAAAEAASERVAGGADGGPGTDLSRLTTCLAPLAAVDEPDEIWDFDAILQDMAQTLQAEKDKRMGTDKGLVEVPSGGAAGAASAAADAGGERTKRRSAAGAAGGSR